MYRILLVDDEKLLLESLEIILSLNDMEVIGKAEDGMEALAILAEKTCDIALVDLNMKGMGGIELIGKMRCEYPAVKILVLTTFYDDRNITDAISNGADGYLMKDSGKDAILGAIRQIMGGVTVLDRKVMQKLSYMMNQGRGIKSENDIAGKEVSNMAGYDTEDGDVSKISGYDTPAKSSQYDMTVREQEICTLMVEGLNNRQIAERLYISEGTVKNYISNIYDKTGIHDRVKLIIELKR